MTRFEFWQETYLTSLRRLNAYKLGDEEKLTKHAARIADESVMRFGHAAADWALGEELEELDDEDEEMDEEDDAEVVEMESPDASSATQLVPAQR